MPGVSAQQRNAEILRFALGDKSVADHRISTNWRDYAIYFALAALSTPASISSKSLREK